VASKPRFTRIPKTTALVSAGVPAEAIGTYTALADHANNKTGLCWPKMETLAATLNRSVRTIQRHLHLLKELGLIESRWTSGFLIREELNYYEHPLYPPKNLLLMATSGCLATLHHRRHRNPMTKHSKNSGRSKQNDGLMAMSGSSISRAPYNTIRVGDPLSSRECSVFGFRLLSLEW
jgi:hypothetical protein